MDLPAQEMVLQLMDIEKACENSEPVLFLNCFMLYIYLIWKVIPVVYKGYTKLL